MRRFALVVVAVMACWMMAGCAVGQKIPLTYTPEQVEAAQGVDTLPLSVTVTDDRPYVVSGDKNATFIGKYRAGFGNTWDVSTEGKTPLAQILYRDLTADLRKFGLTLVPNSTAERRLTVSIQDYNFDCYINCRVWHHLKVEIKDTSGSILHARNILDEQDVSGSAMWGPKGAMEAELPKIYNKMIRNIVRGDAEAMAALKRPDDAKK